ncbi:MAG: phosphotransferase family protein [Saccharospirillum sp.]|nr:phosphotransferase family protein [Saccharospirillum sp.]
MTQALTHVLDHLKAPLSTNLNVARLPGGLCNRLYRLTTAEGCFALRSNHPGSEQLGVDRELERRVLAAIAGQAWSPQVLECEAEWLLSRWVEGLPPAQGELTDLTQLLGLMQSVHAIQPEVSVLNMARRLEELVAAGPAWPEPAASGLALLLRQYELPERLCLCHNDWHPGNLLVTTDGWVLLDWEYAALGDPAMDVAAACQGFRLPEAQAAALAEALSVDLPRLNQARAMMEAIALAWYRLLSDQTGANGDSPDAWWLRWQSNLG